MSDRPHCARGRTGPGAARFGRAVAAALLAVLLVVAADVRAGSIEETARPLGLTLLHGQPAPPFTLPDLAGGSVSLERLRGQVVLLYFWASW